jgi:Fic-DOC domain mobile mystery protein B
VSDLLDEEPEGATPLTPEEREGLIPAQVTLRRELNELEQENILEASLWVTRRSRDPVSETFARNLHRRMFSKVWRWAGSNRASNKNIGCDWWEIDLQLRGVLEDTRTWIEFSSYPADEIAVRFHHRLVAIHPFANGNGRWSRLMGDTLARRLGRPAFSWGNSSLLDDDATRRAYIDALRVADGHNVGPLLSFARS